MVLIYVLELGAFDVLGMMSWEPYLIRQIRVRVRVRPYLIRLFRLRCDLSEDSNR